MRPLPFILVTLGALSACDENPAPDDETQPIRSEDVPRIESAEQALDGAHVPTIDPMTMNDAEIGNVLGAGPFCAFRYTSDGRPVLAFRRQADDSTADGVVKLNGSLVPLQRSGDGALAWHAGDVRLMLNIAEESEAERIGAARPEEADLLFEIGRQLRVGYRGYYVCASPMR